MRRPLPPIVATAAMALVLAVTATTASAWPYPTASGTARPCHDNGTRYITWTVHNLETGFPNSPGSVVDVSVSHGTVGTFSPAVLPNTGQATATATSSLSAGHKGGEVTLKYTLRWAGDDGSHEYPSTVTVKVRPCPQSTTTVPPTTAAPTTTATSSIPTTTTTAAPTTSIAVAQAIVEEPAEAPPAQPVVASPQFTG